MRLSLVAALFSILAHPGICSAQTAITYQGQLQQGNAPFTGVPGMDFRLYDSPDGDNQIGDTVVLSGVEVENGLFQVELDFGAGAFDGSERYLEIEVAGQILTPRQRINGTPSAQFALEVPDESVDSSKIAPEAVGSAQIAPGAVGANELQDSSLTIASGTGLEGGGEIALGGSAVLGIADDGVGSAQIASGAVGSAQIASGAVGADQADSSQVQLRITGTCESGTTLVGISSDGSVECAPLPIGLAWLADSAGFTGSVTSIAIRDSGLPIVSYNDNTNDDVKVFDCSNTACSAGTARTLDSGGNVGSAETSIAIRDSGLPIVSYYDNNPNESLKAFDCSNTACSAGTARTLDSGGLVGEYSSIAIRDSGLPIISYYDAGNEGLKAFDCSNTACSAGTARTLDSGGSVGEYTSIAIRDSGLPIISYWEANDSLKAFDCSNTACSAGTARTLDSGGLVAEYSSIAIRDNGKPIISYWDANNFALKVFDCSNTACSAGTARILDSGASVGLYTSIAIRDTGLPIISYYDASNGNLKAFDCSNTACSAGTARTLDSDGGVETSIAIRDSGLPIISYRASGLKIYSCGDVDCAR